MHSNKHFSSLSVNFNMVFFLIFIKVRTIHLFVIFNTDLAFFVINFSKTISKAFNPSCLRDRNSLIQDTFPASRIVFNDAMCFVSMSIVIFLKKKSYKTWVNHNIFTKFNNSFTCFEASPHKSKGCLYPLCAYCYHLMILSSLNEMRPFGLDFDRHSYLKRAKMRQIPW